MSGLQIEAYQPNVRTRAARITIEEWRKYDPRIIGLHQRATRVRKPGAYYAKRHVMEQLASTPRKSLRLLGMVDPCPDITLTARFSSFQHTTRLKVLGLIRYDMKSGLTPLENSGGTCTSDSLDCCTKDRSIHSHSRWPDKKELAPTAVYFREYASHPSPLADMLHTSFVIQQWGQIVPDLSCRDINKINSLSFDCFVWHVDTFTH
jgi:hypothetical protein